MPSDNPRLVVVDDEPQLRDMVAEYLGRNGFSVRTAADSAGLDASLASEPADLVLLDVNMPGEDGFSIARRLRASSKIPIVMLTAADDVIDRVVGLEIGADDYITKPFDLRELRARLRTILRRVHHEYDPPQPITHQDMDQGADAGNAPAVNFGRVILDIGSRCLVHEDGTIEKLTTMEFDLLNVFAQNPHRVLTRERLLDLAHNRANDPFDRSIDIRITRIRRKIEIDPTRPEILKTVRGVGYIFIPSKK